MPVSQFEEKNQQEQESMTEESTGFIDVLKNKNFATLWLGQIFSQLADKIYLVLMIAIISSNFQPDGESISSWVSLVMIAFTLPAIFSVL